MVGDDLGFVERNLIVVFYFSFNSLLFSLSIGLCQGCVCSDIYTHIFYEDIFLGHKENILKKEILRYC